MCDEFSGFRRNLLASLTQEASLDQRAAFVGYLHGHAIGFFSYIDRVLRDALVGRSALGVMA